MRKKIIFVLTTIVLFACNKKTDNLIQIRVTDSVINIMQGGFGASMHAIEDSLPVSTYNGNYRSYGGSAWGGNPPAEDSARWNQIYQHCDWLGLDWCRVEIEHRMFEPQKGKFTFNNKEMHILYRWLDYCQHRNVDVYLTEMWPHARWLVHKNFLGDGIKELLSAPSDFNAWADGLTRLLNFLINEKKYTCIKWLSIVNEPMEEWSWWKKADGSSQDIIDGLKIMKEKLAAAGLPVKLVATDGSLKYETKAIEKYLPYIGAISFHDYSATYDWWNSKPFIADDVDAIGLFKKLGRENGNLPVFMAEFGTMMFGFTKDTNAPSQWRSMLHDVQLMIRMSQAGIDGMNRWSLTNRGDLDGQWQLIDTWDTATKSLRKNITPHVNAYYGIGLITRFTAKNSEVLHTIVDGGKDTLVFERLDHSKDTVHRVFATTFRKDNNYSIFITNDSEQEYPLELTFEKGRMPLPLYLYAINEKDHKDKINCLIEPIEINPYGKSIKGVIRPKSLMVYTTYKLSHTEKGIIE